MKAALVLLMKQELVNKEYKYGFVTTVEAEVIEKGLSEKTVRQISEKKNEPEWMLEYRLKAYRHFLTLKMPDWAKLEIPPIDLDAIHYYSAPKKKETQSLDEVDPEVLATFEKLGIPLDEQKRISGVAVDAVFDSVSIATTNQSKLEEAGVIFCSISEALQNHPDLVKKHLGTVVHYTDNYFAALNAAVFSDGSFAYIPRGVKCPLDLSTYFRINAENTGQFERTLIVAEDGSFVNYLEGCTAPQRDENQLHAAVVELIANDDATINYSTVQNWYAGDEKGNGGIYNFVTKRGNCVGKNSKITWTQVEAGSAITWKYPSCNLIGDYSVGEFYSVALTNNKMQADTGTKMVHIGKNTKSTIISKGISAEKSNNVYRGLVKIVPRAKNARNYTQCDSMLVGRECGAHTFPYVEVGNNSSVIEHEASTSKINEDQLFYLESRGIDREKAISMIVHGFCGDVIKKLPLEFAAEAEKLLQLKLENSVG